jgi:hypothetical protein
LQKHIQRWFQDTVVPKEMTIEDIKQTVLDFKNGAKMQLLQDLMVLNYIRQRLFIATVF